MFLKHIYLNGIRNIFRHTKTGLQRLQRSLVRITIVATLLGKDGLRLKIKELQLAIAPSLIKGTTFKMWKGVTICFTMKLRNL